jgi:alkanesulfonate monooxygenase SsuD/methylene tetrahydromethanopterin reductase-like flavin-dependent oxidoreductase (luciferase family)
VSNYASDFRPLDRTEGGMTYGLLIPHFGAEASPKRIIDAAVLAEDGGFDAVWVRDHLIWEPHGMEGNNRTFVEPLACLAAIASRTSRIFLGTAVLIPVRWPLKLAQDLASLSYLAGGRVIAGMGLGSGQKELGAVGFRREDRKKIFVETAKIMEQVWSENHVSFDGDLFSFEDVNIEPKPVDPIPIWYGGTTRISAKNAVEYCSGWMPGRTPLATLDDRMAYLDELSAEAGKKITRSIIPLVKVDRDRKKARADIDIEALAGSSEASKTWVVPEGGFKSIDDLGGILAVGTPEEVVEQVAELGRRGIDHYVFDLRMQYDRYEESVALIAEEILPALRKMKA